MKQLRCKHTGSEDPYFRPKNQSRSSNLYHSKAIFKKRGKFLSNASTDENNPVEGSAKRQTCHNGKCASARRLQSLITSLQAALSSEHVQRGPPIATPSQINLAVQQLLIELATAKDRVGVLEKELGDICLQRESAMQPIEKQLDKDDNDPDAHSDASSVSELESDTGPFPAATGFPYPYDEYTQTWDRGMAVLYPNHVANWAEYGS